MAQQNTDTIVRSIFDAINRKDFAALDQVGSANAEYVEVALNKTLKGASAARDIWQGWSNVFPDLSIEIRNIVSGPDFAVVEAVGRGTHKGVFKTPMGDFQPTGNKGELPFCQVIHFENGKIRKLHAYFDLFTMVKQMGLELELRKAA